MNILEWVAVGVVAWTTLAVSLAWVVTRIIMITDNEIEAQKARNYDFLYSF